MKQPLPKPVAPTQQVATSLSSEAGPSLAFLNEALLSAINPLHGASGKVYFTTRTGGAAIVNRAPSNSKAVLSEAGKTVEVSPEFVAPSNPGMYHLAVQLGQATEAIDNLNVITLVPFAQKQAGHIGLYYLGTWPFSAAGGRKHPRTRIPPASSKSPHRTPTRLFLSTSSCAIS